MPGCGGWLSGQRNRNWEARELRNDFSNWWRIATAAFVINWR